MTKKEEGSGEWMYLKIDQIKNLVAKTEFGLIPDMLKEIMYPTMSYLTTQDIEKIVIPRSSLGKGKERRKYRSIQRNEQEVEGEGGGFGKKRNCA